VLWNKHLKTALIPVSLHWMHIAIWEENGLGMSIQVLMTVMVLFVDNYFELLHMNAGMFQLLYVVVSGWGIIPVLMRNSKMSGIILPVTLAVILQEIQASKRRKMYVH